MKEHGVEIAPSTYYEARSRKPSKRALRDAEIVELIITAREQRFIARFGARKMWLYLRRQGHDVARCTVERLMTQNGWQGALRGKRVRTTIPDPKDARAADLVDRDFAATAPNQLWVADFQCRRRHWKSYADLRTMPMLPAVVQVIDGAGARKVGIVLV